MNPIAGLGGTLAWHGTDGRTLSEAVASGATPQAGERARRAVARLIGSGVAVEFLAAADVMGSAHLPPGEAVTVVPRHRPGPTSAADTASAVRTMVRHGTHLILFAGGDGTAHAVAEAAGDQVPILGVPCGVKMRSGVFAATPEAAGDLVARYVSAPETVPLRCREIVDLVPHEDGSRQELLTLARVPDDRLAVPPHKSSGPRASEAELNALAARIVEQMSPQRLYLLGPGATTGRIASRLGFSSSPLGVDAVVNGERVAADASEPELLALLHRYQLATLIVGVIGGQGFLFGRGNQQLSARVLSMIGIQNLLIIAARDKMLTLNPPLLRVDLAPDSPPPGLSGYHRVHVGTNETVVMRVAS